MKDFLFNLRRRIDFSLNFGSVLEILLLIAIWPIMKYAPASWFVEDGIVENLQLVILVIAMTFCLRAKADKKFFIMSAMIVFLLLLRETNMGRSYFCEKYLVGYDRCAWKYMKYGYVPGLLRNIFGAFIVFYVIKNKVYQVFFKYMKDAKIYVVDFLMVFIGALLGVVAEFRSIDNEILEEVAESLFYIALANILWIYGHRNIFENEAK